LPQRAFGSGNGAWQDLHLNGCTWWTPVGSLLGVGGNSQVLRALKRGVVVGEWPKDETGRASGAAEKATGPTTIDATYARGNPAPRSGAVRL
jgi:hypothetical protein